MQRGDGTAPDCCGIKPFPGPPRAAAEGATRGCRTAGAKTPERIKETCPRAGDLGATCDPGPIGDPRAIAWYSLRSWTFASFSVGSSPPPPPPAYALLARSPHRAAKKSTRIVLLLVFLWYCALAGGAGREACAGSTGHRRAARHVSPYLLHSFCSTQEDSPLCSPAAPARWSGRWARAPRPR
jgi:hypothetical protein